MGDAIIVALITGGLTLVGTIVSVVVTSNKNYEKTSKEMQIAQAVTDTKISDLTQEMREYRELSRKIPAIEEQVKAVSHRVDTLEQKGA